MKELYLTISISQVINNLFIEAEFKRNDFLEIDDTELEDNRGRIEDNSLKFNENLDISKEDKYYKYFKEIFYFDENGFVKSKKIRDRNKLFELICNFIVLQKENQSLIGDYLLDETIPLEKYLRFEKGQCKYCKVSLYNENGILTNEGYFHKNCYDDYLKDYLKQ